MKNLDNNYQKEGSIDIEKSYELWDWADKLKVSAESLKRAVLTVGKSVVAVRSFLKK